MAKVTATIPNRFCHTLISYCSWAFLGLPKKLPYQVCAKILLSEVELGPRKKWECSGRVANGAINFLSKNNFQNVFFYSAKDHRPEYFYSTFRPSKFSWLGNKAFSDPLFDFVNRFCEAVSNLPNYLLISISL